MNTSKRKRRNEYVEKKTSKWKRRKGNVEASIYTDSQATYWGKDRHLTFIHSANLYGAIFIKNDHVAVSALEKIITPSISR